MVWHPNPGSGCQRAATASILRYPGAEPVPGPLGSMTQDSFAHTTMLLRDAHGGSDSALDELFERYLPRIRRIVAARLGRPLAELVDDDDIVQETLLDALRQIRSAEAATIGRFQSWLARCVENNLRDAWRRAGAQKRDRGRVVSFGDLGSEFVRNTVPDQGASPSGRAGEAELDERLERGLLALRREFREVVVLRVLCGMSFAEIAVELKLEDAALARSWLSRALAELRRDVRLEDDP